MSLSAADEALLKRYYECKILSLCGRTSGTSELRRPEQAAATSIRLFKRFYATTSIVSCDPRAIMAAASDTLKKVFLELGGKSAFLVLDDADALLEQQLTVTLPRDASFLSAEIVRLGRTAAGETLTLGFTFKFLSTFGRRVEILERDEL